MLSKCIHSYNAPIKVLPSSPHVSNEGPDQGIKLNFIPRVGEFCLLIVASIMIKIAFSYNFAI